MNYLSTFKKFIKKGYQKQIRIKYKIVKYLLNFIKNIVEIEVVVYIKYLFVFQSL